MAPWEGAERTAAWLRLCHPCSGWAGLSCVSRQRSRAPEASQGSLPPLHSGCGGRYCISGRWLASPVCECRAGLTLSTVLLALQPLSWSFLLEGEPAGAPTPPGPLPARRCCFVRPLDTRLPIQSFPHLVSTPLALCLKEGLDCSGRCNERLAVRISAGLHFFLML